MKNVLVIGGTSGYGAGIASHLAKLGHRVFVASRRTLPSLDVTDKSSVEACFDHLKKTGFEVDVVVYSAGLAVGKDDVKDKADLDTVFDTNTKGLLYALKSSFPALESTSGHFIHLGSIAAFLNYKGGADYCASKAASNSIMKTIRHEWLGTGIRTTSLEIGLGNTNFMKNRYDGDMEKAKKHYGTIRQIEPEDLGEMVSYILNLPDRLNVDEVILKPIDQASHGVTIDNLKKQF